MDKIQRYMKEIGSLRQVFNNAAEKKSYKEGYSRPAAEFEEKTGISGIAGRYNFPQGFSQAEFEDLMIFLRDDKPALSHYEGIPSFLQDVWEGMKSANPQLNDIRVDKKNENEIYKVLFGVTSAFNADDINYFLDIVRLEEPPYEYSMKQRKYSKLSGEIEKRAGCDLYWVPAPATLEKIIRKLDERDEFILSSTRSIHPRTKF